MAAKEKLISWMASSSLEIKVKKSQKEEEQSGGRRNDPRKGWRNRHRVRVLHADLQDIWEY